MRIPNILFVIIFVLSAALQYNDPDPYLWIPLYLYGGFLCFQAIRGKFHPALYTLGLIVYSGYALYLFFDSSGVLSWFNEHEAESLVQSMKASKPWIEETREFLGLLILIVALLANMFWFRRKTLA